MMINVGSAMCIVSSLLEPPIAASRGPLWAELTRHIELGKNSLLNWFCYYKIKNDILIICFVLILFILKT